MDGLRRKYTDIDAPWYYLKILSIWKVNFIIIGTIKINQTSGSKLRNVNN